MVWFSEDVLTTEMIFENYLSRLRHVPLEEGEEERRAAAVAASEESGVSPTLQVSRRGSGARNGGQSWRAGELELKGQLSCEFPVILGG